MPRNIWQINAKKHTVEKQIQQFTTLLLTIRVYLHSFSCSCPQIVEISRNSPKIQTYSSLRSFKVIDLRVNRKRICNFLLVIDSDLDVSATVFEILTHLARK